MIRIILVTLIFLITPPSANCRLASVYTVQSGDWLSKIAREYYDDAALYPLIVECTNHYAPVWRNCFRYIDDPDRIYPGDCLLVPELK